MFFRIKPAVLFALCHGLGLVSACEEDPAHNSRRRHLSVPLIPPTRPLQWGDVNILHTTDTHGWLLGHQKPSFPEPNYRQGPCQHPSVTRGDWFLDSGDFGEFASFVSHMKRIAEVFACDWRQVENWCCNAGKRCRPSFSGFRRPSWWLVASWTSAIKPWDDLWVLTIGTGLVDGFPPGGIDGHDVWFFFANSSPSNATLGAPIFQKIALWCPGHWKVWISFPSCSLANSDHGSLSSHELYVHNNTLDVCDKHYKVEFRNSWLIFCQHRHRNFAPRFKGRYLSSNVNITYVDKNSTVMNTPVGCTISFLPSFPWRDISRHSS